MLYGGLWVLQWWSVNEYSMVSDNAVAEVEHDYSSYLIGISHSTSSDHFDISSFRRIQQSLHIMVIRLIN